MTEKQPNGLNLNFYQLGPKKLITSALVKANENDHYFAKLEFANQKIITLIQNSQLRYILENLKNYCIQLEYRDNCLLTRNELQEYVETDNDNKPQFVIHIFDKTGQRYFGMSYVYLFKVDDKKDTIVTTLERDIDHDRTLLVDYIQNYYANLSYLELAEKIYTDIKTHKLPDKLGTIIICQAEKRAGFLNRHLKDLPQYQ